MTISPSRMWDRCRRVGVALLALMTALAVSGLLPREAGAQTSRKAKPKPAATKSGDAEDAPKGSAEAPAGGAKALEPAAPSPPVEFETVKLTDGTEMPVKKWGETFAAYEYHPPIDILDRRVHVVLDQQRNGAPGPVNALEIDSEGGRLYWTEGSQQSIGPGQNVRGVHFSGRVMRAHLDGTKVETLAADRIFPHSLVIDKKRGMIYWLEGALQSPCTLQSATLDGKKERILSKGLSQPFGLALDSARGHLYYWEHYRLVRVNVDGTGEEIVTTNPNIVRPGLEGLAFDAAQDRLYSAIVHLYRWLDKDGTHPKEVPRIHHWTNIHGFAFDEINQKIYFSNGLRALLRANPDGTQVESLVTSPDGDCPDGWSRTIAGGVAFDTSNRSVPPRHPFC